MLCEDLIINKWLTFKQRFFLSKKFTKYKDLHIQISILQISIWIQTYFHPCMMHSEICKAKDFVQKTKQKMLSSLISNRLYNVSHLQNINQLGRVQAPRLFTQLSLDKKGKHTMATLSSFSPSSNSSPQHGRLSSRHPQKTQIIICSISKTMSVWLPCIHIKPKLLSPQLSGENVHRKLNWS